MSYFLKIILAVVFAIFLSGCKYSNPYLVRHPSTFQSILSTCQSMGEEAKNDAQCQSAIVLYQQVNALGRQLMSNPAEFGRGILNDQMNLNQLQQKIDKFLPKNGKILVKSDTEQLKKLQIQYQVLQEQVEVKQGILGQMEEP